jgi:8-oxo-dGTP pyrophosphatase MutT (NUDIX family)
VTVPTAPAAPGEPWTPTAGLLFDVEAALAQAPLDTPEDRFEAWAWQRLLADRGPVLLTRHGTPGHITASGVVLTLDGSLTCLVLHRRLRQWVQPGGHLEPSDSVLAAAAAREVWEETGVRGVVRPAPLHLSRHRAPCRPDVVDWHLDVQHLVLAPEATTPEVSEESVDVQWWPTDQLPEALAPGTDAAIARAVTLIRRRFPR